MVDQELLKILADPKTKEPLRLATADELKRGNAAITQGTKNVGGQDVQDALTEALVAANAKRVYPVRDGIPGLLADEASALPESPARLRSGARGLPSAR